MLLQGDRCILCFSEALFDVEISVGYLKAEYEIFAAVNVSCLVCQLRMCCHSVRNDVSSKLF